MLHKNMIIKKYIQFKLMANNIDKNYIFSSFIGNIEIDLNYIILMLFDMELEGLLDCANNLKRISWQSETVYLDVFDYSVDITSVYDLPYLPLQRENYSINHAIFTFARNDFKDLINNYKLFTDQSMPTYYLILASNNRIFLQEELTDNNLTLPLQSLQYIKIVYMQKDLYYKVAETTSSELSGLSMFHFHLNSHDIFLQQYEFFKKNELISKDISFEMISKIIEKWNLLKSEEQPVYFVKEDDGSITVRKTILDLKYVKLEINESGEYHVADEYGIEVFDFLEEFVIGFDPEKWFAEFEHAITEDSGYQVHQNVEILYSIKEHFVLLRLGKAPQEYEYIERDRAQYKEDRDVLMPLDNFQNLMQQWIDLKREKTPEIWFRQKENGSIVID